MKKVIAKIAVSFFSVLCTLITLIQFFIGTNTFKEFCEKLNITEDFEIKTIYKIFFFFCVLIITSICVIVSYLKKSKINNKIAESIHYVNQEIINETDNMHYSKDKKEYESHLSYYKDIKNKCFPICQNIADFIKNKCGKEFSVCLKMTYYPKTDNHRQAVYTLCRAGKNYKNREDYENKKNKISYIDKNSDFENILNPSIERDYFAASNLFMVKKLSGIFGLKYENSTKNFMKFYLSTIVVPIRIDSGRLHQANIPDVDLKEKHPIIAFLCIDYKHPISKALKEELLIYMKGFANTFSNLFYEIILEDRNIKDN